MVYDKFKERIRVLPWLCLAAILLASVERLLAYRRAYLRRNVLPDLDLSGEPDLKAVLDRAWVKLEGVALPSSGSIDLGVGPRDLWGALANQQIKALALDCAEAVADEASAGHLRTLLQSVLDSFASIQEFEDDGFVTGPPSWAGVEEMEREAIEGDLAWVESHQSVSELMSLRDKWRDSNEGVTLTDS